MFLHSSEQCETFYVMPSHKARLLQRSLQSCTEWTEEILHQFSMAVGRGC